MSESITSVEKCFKYLWKNQFSMIPPMDKMTLEEREKLKEFAWKIYLEGYAPSPIVRNLLRNH